MAADVTCRRLPPPLRLPDAGPCGPVEPTGSVRRASALIRAGAQPAVGLAGPVPVKLLTSEANPLFRGWLRLAGKPRSARDLGQTLAEGLHLAQAPLDAKWPVTAPPLRRLRSGPGINRVLDQCPPP